MLPRGRHERRERHTEQMSCCGWAGGEGTSRGGQALGRR